MQNKERISAYLDAHRDALVEDAKKLIRIRSDKGAAQPGQPFGPGPAKALAEALDIAAGYGFSVQNYDNYVGAVDFLPENDHHLDILSHLDCVPVADGWTVTEPFDPVVRDGKLYGRGACDDKGPSIAALYAVRCIRELGIPLRRNVRLIWGCDEECGSSDIAHYYEREPEAAYTFSPDAEFPLINIEKGGLHGELSAAFSPAQDLPRVLTVDAGLKLNVVPDKCRTVLEGMRRTVAEIYCAKVQEETGVRFSLTENADKTLTIDAQGVGAHAASPEKGNNAVTATLQLLSVMHLPDSGQTAALRAMAKLFPHGDYLGAGLGVQMSDETSGELTLSLNILHVTADGLSAEFDARCPLAATEQNMKQAAMAACAAVGITLKDSPMKPPHHVPADSPFVKTLLEAYGDFTGDTGAKPLAIGGGTYCHELKNGVAFGCCMPGVDGNMHGNDEFAVVEDLVLSAKIFADAILRICG